MPQKPKAPFAIFPRRVANAHYIDFLAETYGAISTNLLREAGHGEKLPLFEEELADLQRCIKPDRNVKVEYAELSEGRIRLVIENRKGELLFAIDQVGVVKVKDKPSYYVERVKYLAISRLMESLAEKVAKFRNVKRYE